jgi:hypothetical protein
MGARRRGNKNEDDALKGIATTAISKRHRTAAPPFRAAWFLISKVAATCGRVRSGISNQSFGSRITDSLVELGRDFF